MKLFITTAAILGLTLTIQANDIQEQQLEFTEYRNQGLIRILIPNVDSASVLLPNSKCITFPNKLKSNAPVVVPENELRIVLQRQTIDISVQDNSLQLKRYLFGLPKTLTKDGENVTSWDESTVESSVQFVNKPLINESIRSHLNTAAKTLTVQLMTTPTVAPTTIPAAPTS